MTWTDFSLIPLAGIILAAMVWIMKLRRRIATGTRAVAESADRYALVLAGTNDGIWERNFVTGEVHRTQRICEILGFEPD